MTALPTAGETLTGTGFVKERVNDILGRFAPGENIAQIVASSPGPRSKGVGLTWGSTITIREIVKIPCRYLGQLNLMTDARRGGCGGSCQVTSAVPWNVRSIVLHALSDKPGRW